MPPRACKYPPYIKITVPRCPLKPYDAVASKAYRERRKRKLSREGSVFLYPQEPERGYAVASTGGPAVPLLSSSFTVGAERAPPNRPAPALPKKAPKRIVPTLISVGEAPAAAEFGAPAPAPPISVGPEQHTHKKQKKISAAEWKQIEAEAQARKEKRVPFAAISKAEQLARRVGKIQRERYKRLQKKRTQKLYPVGKHPPSFQFGGSAFMDHVDKQLEEVMQQHGGVLSHEASDYLIRNQGADPESLAREGPLHIAPLVHGHLAQYLEPPRHARLDWIPRHIYNYLAAQPSQAHYNVLDAANEQRSAYYQYDMLRNWVPFWMRQELERASNDEQDLEESRRRHARYGRGMIEAL
jgi:hypothetical protein